MAAATATTAALATPPPAITAAAAAATAAGSVRAWALATRSAAVAAWRGFPTVLPTPKTGGAVLPLTAAAPPRSVAARGRGRFAAELADARSAVADLAGAAVAILLVPLLRPARRRRHARRGAPQGRLVGHLGGAPLNTRR
eukprot:TRINITY_DN5364_c0_g1_i2.p3 TRINITY_DN5364_c0_g1~~TRINITY_DN5364_c0_g1_i2.p3  ORF type:complete len:141 (+),score=27.36 TRINITY_DN5364_c0_g1_i2:286-708(+)